MSAYNVLTEEGRVEVVLEEQVARRWLGSVGQHHSRHSEGTADAQVCDGHRRARHHLPTLHYTGMRHAAMLLKLPLNATVKANNLPEVSSQLYNEKNSPKGNNLSAITGNN